MRTIVSISSKKSKKNPRSQLLSALMRELGGDTGDALANSFVGSNSEDFKMRLSKVVDKVVSKMPNAST